MGNQDQTRARSQEPFTGPNLAYVLDEYERYLSNPEEVSEKFREYFAKWTPPADQDVDVQEARQASQALSQTQVTDATIAQVSEAQQLVRDIQEYGHLVATTNPLQTGKSDAMLIHGSNPQVSTETLKQMPARWVWANAPKDVHTAADAISRLREIYTGDLAFDFAHVHTAEEQNWLTTMVESGQLSTPLPDAEKEKLLEQLIEVDAFEQFLQRTFVGQKRFSIEGVDMLVPMLSGFISQAVEAGTTSVMIGMAHRGRLNTLAHILGKPYEAIFSEFHTSVNKDLVPSEGSTGINYGWTGDVKYHLGARRNVRDEGVKEVHLALANNPSHLEFVDPVVEGFARAAQEGRDQAGPPRQDLQRAVAILVHGDAAFPGEGIVAETLNLSNLSGYQTGGTIHIIANNQLGFTAEADEGRSTRYASDLARGFEIPIVHVSADNPEACMQAVMLAQAYRQKFHKDFLIDLIGYRRWGHNEMDDPMPTQPAMYQQIKDHPRIREIYAQELESGGLITAEKVKELETQVQEKLKAAHQRLKSNGWQAEPNTDMDGTEIAIPETGVSAEQLRTANESILSDVEGFTVYGKLKRVLDRRKTAFDEDKIDWAHAEELAFATVLMDGIPIRMTGQDSERGTFSQRHLVMHDEHTGLLDCPLQRLPQARASFAIHNSPLSEAGVLGFEYGYDVQARDALVLWEAQFGDFANAAQVIIDQFLASGWAKWRQPSGLVLLLPHGYEGQGPEHSSARLERYLQLSAETNWRVVYPTTSAQYFHLLRSQAAILGETSRPLIVMTPKSLLRNPRVVSAKSEFTSGRFEPLLQDSTFAGNLDDVRRLVLASGKVAVDLAAALDDLAEDDRAWLTYAKLEQVYPFPAKEVTRLVDSFPNLQEVVWLQEEPANMGAWSFVQPRLQEILPRDISLSYAGRSAHASPAEGSANVHQTLQDEIVHSTLMPHTGRTLVRTGGNSK